MNSEIILSFITNIMLLMSLAVVYSIFPYQSKLTDYWRKIIMGIVVALVGITIMSTSYELMPGIVFDSRAVAISVTAMFLGFIPTLIGATVMIIFRLFIGGSGAFTGVLWILFASIIGLLWRQFRLKNHRFEKNKVTWIELYIISFAIQVVMITLLLTLHSDIRTEVISAVAFPLIIIYPFGSLLISEFMLTQRLRYFQHIKTIESEKQYKILFSDSKAMIMLIDPIDGSIIDVNESALQKYKYTYDEITKMKISDINTLGIDATLIEIEKATSEEQSYFLFKHKTKDNKIIDVEIYSGPMKINDKEYLLSSMFDVTEKLERERLFKDVDEKLHATLLSVGEGIVLTDEFSKITLINDKALELLGESKRPLGKKICDVFRIYSNQSTISFKEIYTECISKNKVFKGDITYSLLRNDNDEQLFVDFSISPINTDEGKKNGAILVIRDETIEQERQAEIRYISQHDYLTGLYNRFFFEEQIRRLDTVRQLPLTIIMGDVNGLKLVNDAYSHIEGDRLLIEIAQIMKKATRSEDILARWGGDEFVILLPQTSLEDSMKVYSRVKDLCEKSMYSTITPSIALGCATKTSEKENIESIIKLAEEKMYHEKTLEGKKMRNNLIASLESKLYENSEDNKIHIEHMVSLVSNFSDLFNLPKDDAKTLTKIAKLHDIGFVAIDKDILLKSGTLNEAEWERIRSHPEIGSRIVQSIPELQHITKGILHHHEWFDGTGYPQELSGSKIPLFSRIISVLDAYDVMTTGRIYKDKITHDEAIKELIKFSGTQFDPEIVQKFINSF